MPISDIATVTLSTTNPGVTAPGFGTVAILSHTATWAERSRTYANITAVAVDFAPTTVEWQAANQIFSQTPAPTRIKILRATADAAWYQNWVISVQSVQDSTAYSCRIKTPGGTYQTATFTSGAGTTNDLIAAGIKAAIDALAAPALAITTSLTGGAGSQVVDIVADNAVSTGAWFAIEIMDNALLRIVQDQVVPPTTAIATDLTAINTEDNDWYGLVSLYNSSAYVQAIATWVESNEKVYIAASQDTEIIQTTYGAGSDVAKTLAAAARVRTHVCYHPDPAEFMDASLFGKFFPKNPGSVTWRMKTLSGVTAKTLTGTHQVNAEAKYASYYYNITGTTSVVGGDAKVAGNEFIDVIRGRDWWVAEVQTGLANLLIQADKIPFTNAGAAQVEAIIRGANDLGIKRTVIADSPAPTVSVPDVADVSDANKALRVLPDVTTQWVLAGAIHSITVTASITA
jgi:hypothetical protein